MPHLLIEFSSNVEDHHDIGALVEATHAAAVATGVAPLTGMRTRAVRRDVYRVADGAADNAFIALQLRIGPGRSLEVKRGLIEAVLDAAQRSVPEQEGPLAIAWSIELSEIDAEVRINRNNIATRIESGGR